MKRAKRPHDADHPLLPFGNEAVAASPRDQEPTRSVDGEVDRPRSRRHRQDADVGSQSSVRKREGDAGAGLHDLARCVLDIAAEVEDAELRIKQELLSAAERGEVARVKELVQRWLTKPVDEVLDDCRSILRKEGQGNRSAKRESTRGSAR